MTDLRSTSRNTRGRKVRSAVAVSLIGACLAIALIPLVMIIGVVISKGAPSFNLDCLTKTSISLADKGGGWVHGLIGSLYMLGVATVIVLPIGIAAALY